MQLFSEKRHKKRGYYQGKYDEEHIDHAMVGYVHNARGRYNSIAEKCFSKILVRENDKVKEIYLSK